jgi:hypothetical protein
MPADVNGSPRRHCVLAMNRPTYHCSLEIRLPNAMCLGTPPLVTPHAPEADNPESRPNLVDVLVSPTPRFITPDGRTAEGRRWFTLAFSWRAPEAGVAASTHSVKPPTG